MRTDPTILRIGAATLGLWLLGSTALAQTADTTAEPATPAPAAEGTTEGATGDATGGTDTAAAPDEGLPEISAASVLATVGGRDITLGEIISLRRDLPEQYQFLPDEILSQGLLDQLIDQTLLAEAARGGKLDERLDVALSIRNQIRAVLADAFLRAELQRRMTDERLREVYDARYATNEPQDEIRAAHILVETEEKAAALKAEIDGGADFAALAAEHGTDGTASRGGDLGWFVKADMVPQFADAAFEIAPGSVGGPVESPFGWHLIKVEERRERPIPTLDEVREELSAEMSQTVQAEIMDELRAGATITLSEPPVPAAAIRADDLILPLPEGGEN